MEPRDALLAAESAWMKQAGVHVVVSDIVPLACAAAELVRDAAIQPMALVAPVLATHCFVCVSREHDPSPMDGNV